MTYKQKRNEIREIRARALKKIEENPNDIRAHQTLALFRELPENEDNFDALCHAEVTVEHA